MPKRLSQLFCGLRSNRENPHRITSALKNPLLNDLIWLQVVLIVKKMLFFSSNHSIGHLGTYFAYFYGINNKNEKKVDVKSRNGVN
jgi:hypothetical protein